MVHDATGTPFVSLTYNHFGVPSLRRPPPPGRLAHFAVSRHVACPPPDWPPRYDLTGYFFPEHDGWQPDPALAEFLEGGEPPVVITFGSTEHREPGAVTELVRGAACLGALIRSERGVQTARERIEELLG